MNKNLQPEGGIRTELFAGPIEAVAVDKLVDDFLHNRADDALDDLHQSHREDDPAAE